MVIGQRLFVTSGWRDGLGGRGLPVAARWLAGAGLIALLAAGCDQTDAKSGQTGASKASQAKAGAAKSGEDKATETKSGETKSGETRSGETRSGETESGETKPGETKSGETKPGEDPSGGATPAVVPSKQTHRAVVVDAGALSSLDAAMHRTRLAAAPGAVDCEVDDVHGVVWLVAENGLAAFDLGDNKVHPVATFPAAPPGELAWQVLRPTTGSQPPTVAAGLRDGLQACVALALTIGPKPSAAAAFVADGDRQVYCFDDDDFDSPPFKRALPTEVAASKKAYDSTTLSDEAYLVRLAGRAGKAPRSPHATLAAPKAPKVEVDSTRCDADPEACGTASYVGGGRIWSVVTDNSRGDFFHETAQLYDTKSSEFWQPEGDVRSAKAPADPGDSTPVDVSPDGTWGVHQGKVLSLTDAKVTATLSGVLCGWQ